MIASMTTAQTANLPGVAPGRSGADAGATAEGTGGDFETFLHMLTTQIRNQDPLNPMEGSDFAVQLATFTGVEQQVRSNQLLEAIASGGMGAGGLGQYAGWIGREVRSAAPVLFDGTALPIEVRTDPAAESAVLVAMDARGNVVSREEIGPGNGQIDWLGRDAAGAALPAGSYTFAVESWQGDTLLDRIPAETFSRVTAIESGANGPELVLAGGGRVAASAVGALREAAG